MMNQTSVPADTHRRLRRFVLVDVAACATGALAVLCVHSFVFPSPWLLVLVALVSVTGAMIALSLIPLNRGSLGATIGVIAVANLVVAPLTTAIATFAMPVLVMAPLLPAVLAVPYVPRKRHRVLVIASVLTCVSVVAAGLLQDATHLTEQLPEWVTRSVPIAFTPVMSGIIALIALQNANIHNRSLHDALVTNKALDASRLAMLTQAEALQASRARIVVAGDRERRRIERDLHDGAQQHLMGVALHITNLRDRVSDGELKEDLDAARQRVRLAVSELRNLARGVYPADLATHGLVAAIDSALEQCPLTVKTRFNHTVRFPADIEAAVYFTCLEAIQNIVKHAGAKATVTITLTFESQVLVFDVTDNGNGFDLQAVSQPSGLQNMADRIGSVGGTLKIRSSPGRGTSVSGNIPLLEEEASTPAGDPENRYRDNLRI
jgi:signal transduction histidine kinase